MIRICIRGRNPEYFLNKLINRNIRYSNLVIKTKEIILDVSLDDFKVINSIKTSYEISIISNLGLYKYLVLFRCYFYVVLFFLLGIFWIIFLSNIIFDIEVVHSNNSIRELVYSNLKERGISKYKFKVSYLEKEKIVLDILKNESNDLEWLEIEEVGSKYIVKVEQRKLDKEDEKCFFRHIIAKKDAMVTSIFATSGEVIKKKYDYVKKGDILISGFIYNKENVVAKRCSIGKVIGEVWYKVLVEVPKVYKEEITTGKKCKSLEIIFLNYNIGLFNKYKTYKVDRIRLLENNLLPIGIYFTNYLETNINHYKYNIEDIDNAALEMALDKIYKKLGKDIFVKQKKVLKKEEKESKILVEVFIKVEENIGEYYDISDINIESINKE